MTSGEEHAVGLKSALRRSLTQAPDDYPTAGSSRHCGAGWGRQTERMAHRTPMRCHRPAGAGGPPHRAGRFADDSLTGKALDFLAKAQGMKPQDIANQAKALTPIMLAQVVQPRKGVRPKAQVGRRVASGRGRCPMCRVGHANGTSAAHGCVSARRGR